MRFVLVFLACQGARAGHMKSWRNNKSKGLRGVPTSLADAAPNAAIPVASAGRDPSASISTDVNWPEDFPSPANFSFLDTLPLSDQLRKKRTPKEVDEFKIRPQNGHCGLIKSSDGTFRPDSCGCVLDHTPLPMTDYVKTPQCKLRENHMRQIEEDLRPWSAPHDVGRDGGGIPKSLMEEALPASHDGGAFFQIIGGELFVLAPTGTIDVKQWSDMLLRVLSVAQIPGE
jgi:hypothetical protein